MLSIAKSFRIKDQERCFGLPYKIVGVDWKYLEGKLANLKLNLLVLSEVYTKFGQSGQNFGGDVCCINTLISQMSIYICLTINYQITIKMFLLL